MAATANAPAPFGPPQTPSFPQSSPYMADGLIKQELDVPDLHLSGMPSSPAHPTNHFLPDFPGFAQPEDFAPAAPPMNSTMNADIESLRDRSLSAAGTQALTGVDDFSEDFSGQIASSNQADLESYAAEEVAMVPNVEPMQAYAKLQFSDGDFYVSTQAVELGRDLSAMKYERRMKKQERKRKELEAARAQGEADTPLQLDKNVVKRTVGISGSNASESGGIIGNVLYSGSEDEAKMARRRRKRFLTSNDSSQSQSHSVAPASLHTNPTELGLTKGLFEGEYDPNAARQLDIPFVPIHPAVDRSITGISRKHIRIEYNGEKAYWELHVLGRNGAFIDDETFVEMGAVARLRHNTNIQVQGIDIVFKLPDNAREEEEVAVESDGSDSELSKLDSSPEDGRIMDDQDSGATSDPETPAPKERVKLKLSLSKRGQALDEKTQKSAKISLKAARDKTKGKKTIPGQSEPEASDVRPSIEEESADVKPKTEPAGVPATPAADLPPGSILAGLAPEEIPQKRKGPGRPPKNGVMSKRDEAIIKRKKKELQKAGREIPPLTELLAMARAEAGTTKKGDEGGEGEIAATSAAPGTTPNNGTEGAAASTDAASKPQTQAEIEAAKARKQAKSPSPQKPESEYTEEELKKPQKTYVVLIHDALSASSTGIMDLQQIYDAIQKMYPYYKYRSQTQGWQSSIRHNLIGSEAFEEAGKIGKGRLWKINQNFPIDKEKKRRAPTPPTDKPSYPYYQNNQHSNQGYPAYRPSPYGTPYGPPTTNVQNGARPPPPPMYGQQRNGTYYSPYAANPAGQNHASPYGAQARPPYTQAHAPNQATNGNAANGSAPGTPNAAGTRPPGAVQGQAPPPTAGHAASPAPTQGPNQANAQPPAGRGQPPRPGPTPPPPGAAPPQASIGSDDTIEEIMSYHKRYLGGFRAGADQDAARDLFRKAVSRHIDHNKEHGEFTSEEEKKVADVIGEIIRRNKGKAKQPPPPVPQSRPAGPNPPQQAPGAAGAQYHAGPNGGAARPPQQGAAAIPPHVQQGAPAPHGHPQIAQAPHLQGRAPSGPSPTPAPAAHGTPPQTSHATAPRPPPAQPQVRPAGAPQPAATIDLTGAAPPAAQISRPASVNSQTAPSPRVGSQGPPTANIPARATPVASPRPPSVPATVQAPVAAPTPAANVAPIAPSMSSGTVLAGVKRAAEEAPNEPDAKKTKM
ncbi:hypothetical protein ANO11243_090420 [Dothideomycetidae sp. 11243]|nr:hypothetical protein ANO11243_090420 [fungal sp. No.11243]